MPYNNITAYYDDASDYIDEVITPTYYPEGTATLDKKWVKLWLSPDLEAMDDGGQNFSPQFWGETAYGIILNTYIGESTNGLSDEIPLSQFKSLTADRRTDATNWGEKLNTARTYSTYAPAVIGLDPTHEGYFATLVANIGGTNSVSNFKRDSALDIYNGNISLHLGTAIGIFQSFYYEAGGYDPLDPDSVYEAYTEPPCFLDPLYPSQKSADLTVYFVISYLFPDDTPLSTQRYCAKWVIYSESQNYYKIVTAIPTYGGLNLPFGEPTNEPEGDEPEVPIDFPTPTPNYAVASGMVKVYRLTLSNCQDLASDMWNENWWSQTGHWFGENPPYEAISSLGVVPYAPDGSGNGITLTWSATENISLAGHSLPTAHGNPVTQTTYFTDFSSQSVPTEYGGSFLDYEPYTTVQALLPFIGWVKLPAQFVVGHTVTFRYIIDVISGGVNVFIKNESTGVFAMHSGSCLYSIPVGTADGGRLLDSILTAATAGVSLSTGVGITATKGMDALKVAQHAFDTTVTMRGSASGNMGYCASGNVYLYVHRPNVLDYDQYAPCVGYPTARYMQLSSCQGFTQVDSVNLAGLSASKPEIELFESMLKAGIIIPAFVSQPSTSGGTSGLVTLDLYTRTGCIHELNTSGSVTTRFSAVRGAFRQGDNPTMSNPSIVIEKPFSDVSLVNYVHIAEFNRFYYVEDAVALTGNTTLLVLSSDVLNSFWDSAKNSYAYIARQENATWARTKMIDDKVVTGCMDGSTVDAYEIANPYQGAHQYIVVCAGAT